MGSRELQLRPLQTGDIDVLASWAADAVFCERAGWRSDGDVERVQRFWSAQVEGPAPGLIRLGAVSGRELIGYADLRGYGEVRELGYVVGPSSRWGRGLGGQLARAALRFAFSELELSGVTAASLESNLASMRILRSIGMAEVGIDEAGRLASAPSRHVLFRLSRDDWRAQELATI